MPAQRRAPDDFDPMAVTLPPKDHNQPAANDEHSAFDLIKKEIEDLFEEATNWCDGEPISSQEMHDAVEKLYDGLHEAGKRADTLRVAEKKPLDDKIAAIQAAYNPLIQAKKGKVDLGKSELGKLLAVWRKKVADEKAAAAAAKAAEAAAAAQAAQDAIRASAGNLAARVDAEERLAHAATLQKQAKRADKAATTGLGLRTVWSAKLVDEEAAMEWCWARAKAELLAVAQRNADELVRGGARTVPGFRVVDEKVAA